MKTKHVQYQTQGTCSQLIDVTADEHDVIQQVFFLGGCNGNLQGISQLVRGQKIDDVIRRHVVHDVSDGLWADDRGPFEYDHRED